MNGLATMAARCRRTASGAPCATPHDLYSYLLHQGHLRPCPSQAAGCRALLRLHEALLARTDHATPPRGLYLCGSVGSGKTLLMDLFACCEPQSRRRVHLQSFVSDLQHRLHRRVMQRQSSATAGGPISSPSIRERAAAVPSLRRCFHHSTSEVVATPVRGDETDRPLSEVVDDMIAEHRVLCLDEFQTFDLGNAALIAGFLRLALPRGLTLVATSNRQPQELGNVHHLAARHIAPLIDRYCETVPINTSRDHRLRDNAAATETLVYRHPATQEQEGMLVEVVRQGLRHLTAASDARPTTTELMAVAAGSDLTVVEALFSPREMLHLGRWLRFPQTCGGVVVLQFADLCPDARRKGAVSASVFDGHESLQLGPQDFELLARTFHTAVLLNVPDLNRMTNHNARKQFILFVDELYQHRCRLLMTMEVPLDGLLPDVTGPTTAAGRKEEVFARLSEADDRDLSGTSQASPEPSVTLDEAFFSGEEERFSYARTHSRLKEMSTLMYLESPTHAEYSIDDFDLGAYSRLAATAQWLPLAPVQASDSDDGILEGELIRSGR